MKKDTSIDLIYKVVSIVVVVVVIVDLSMFAPVSARI
jgi:hypothetical protein